MAMNISDADFEKEVLGSDIPVVVDFWAAWCGPCKMISPIVDELSTEMEGKAKIVKMDIDANQGTPVKYGVRNIPTILFFKGGEVVDKQVGAVSKNVLVDKINKLL